MSADKRVDEDWKRRAQQEKELDAAKFTPAPPAAAGAAPGAGGAAPGAAGAPPKSGLREGPPNPHFAGLVESLASQALMFMGAMRDPMTGAVHQDLAQAQQMIEMLIMLDDKTRGNLTKDEAEMMKQVLNEVRMQYVRLTTPPPPGPKGPMMGNRPRGLGDSPSPSSLP
ncbi:MAG TPA: DUF1844 domain-containing protein [Planctomycetota bacterium]|nr:DUF1844 domain-containing protein [Planctomycetota bacterium]